MIPTEYTRIVLNGTKRYAEFYFPRGELGAPCYVWWDLRMCEFKYNQFKDVPGSEVFLKAIDDLK